jgi:hypothetical protein
LINTERIVINLVPGSRIGGIMPEVTASQYDVGRTIELELYNGNVPATLPTGTTAQFECTKPDGHGVSVAASLSNNIVTVNLIKQMTIVAGRVDCKINLLNGANRVGTALFAMDVEKAGVNDSTDLSGSVLPDLIALASEQEAHAAASAASAAASAAGAAASAASAAASAASAESSVNNAVSNARTMLNNAVADATASANSSAAQARANANNAKESAGSAEQAAENGRAWAKSWAVYSSNTNKYGTDHSCSQYWADRSHVWFEKSMTLYGAMQSRIDTVTALLHLLLGSIYLDTQSGDRLITQSGDNLVMSFGEKLYLTTENNEHILTQAGNTIAVTR